MIRDCEEDAVRVVVSVVVIVAPYTTGNGRSNDDVGLWQEGVVVDNGIGAGAIVNVRVAKYHQK